MERKPPDDNDPDAVLSWNDSLLRSLHEGITRGVQRADSIEDEWFDGRYDDPWHWPFSVRRTVRHYLSELPPNDLWHLGPKRPLCGIRLVCEPFAIRIWKAAPSGGPPALKPTYCRQLQLAIEDPARAGLVDLIVDWSVGPQHKVMLAVSKPVGSLNDWEEVVLQYRSTVTFPAAGGLAFPGSTEWGVLAKRRLDQSDREANRNEP